MIFYLITFVNIFSLYLMLLFFVIASRGKFIILGADGVELKLSSQILLAPFTHKEARPLRKCPKFQYFHEICV